MERRLVKIGDAAAMLGVAVSTLRKWESTDVYCAVCARVRLRLCNRRAYHMRRNPETASNDVNDYRTKDELDLFFPSSLYGSRSKKNRQLMDALKDATCTAPTK